jgi:hypothetical protein
MLSTFFHLLDRVFLLYFGKGKFGGKKFTLQKSEFYFAKEFFPSFLLKEILFQARF